jgi:hypothetical protein
MADKLVPSADDTGAIRRFRDMGDGTWAEVVTAAEAASAAGAAGYPAGAVPVAATATGTNAITAATLPAAAGKTTYITGYQVSGGSPTAATLISITLAGVVGGSEPLFFTGPAQPAPLPPVIVSFNPPLPASAANTAITVTASAFGAGSATEVVSLQGFQL